MRASPAVAAEPIRAAGFIGISSAGGDLPSIPDPLLELLFYFAPLVPQPGNVWSVSGEAYATSPVHGTAGGLEVSRPQPPGPLVAGALFDVSSLATWTNGSFTDTFLNPSCNCFEFASYRRTGTFVLSGGNATLMPNGTALTGPAPFTFNGVIDAFNPSTGLPLFQRQFHGRGLATIFTSTSGEDFNYQYQLELSPVPDPGTLILVGSGALALFSRRFRKAH